MKKGFEYYIYYEAGVNTHHSSVNGNDFNFWRLFAPFRLPACNGFQRNLSEKQRSKIWHENNSFVKERLNTNYSCVKISSRTKRCFWNHRSAQVRDCLPKILQYLKMFRNPDCWLALRLWLAKTRSTLHKIQF